MNWQQMTEANVPEVKAMADAIHKNLPEDESIFAERQRLFPVGCHVLMLDDALVGYSIAHPWRFGQPPALNSLLGALPLKPNTLYIHDVALMEHVRGKNAVSSHMVDFVKLALEHGLSSLSLTAVNGTTGFWEKHGFRLLDKPEKIPALASYGDDACSMARLLQG